MTQYYKISRIDGNPLADDSHFEPVTLEQIASENGLVKGGWVSVKDKEPTENKWYPTDVEECEYRHGRWYDREGDQRLVGYYYDLPTPPSEEDKSYNSGNCVVCGKRLWLRDSDAGTVKEMYRVCSHECAMKLPEEPSEEAEQEEECLKPDLEFLENLPKKEEKKPEYDSEWWETVSNSKLTEYAHDYGVHHVSVFELYQKFIERMVAEGFKKEGE